ncbi:transposase [Noviherbaspirillum massiliense]|uniref:transposase n=1 Tax=Noviherbaspirillum massiliense TaxID=1465823 RepID=UPI000474D48D|nr:transposase [Noviherbaspirillum massiliense]
MARLPRLVIPHHPHHVIQRGIDCQAIFRDEEDYSVFLNWLGEASRQFKLALHAYVLMPDHVHFLLTPSDAVGLGRMMQWIGRQYVPYFNRKYGRSGTLWQGRFRATVLEAESFAMLCSRYIELHPVRSGLVTEPEEYVWSSCQHHIGINPNPQIVDHATYWSLGNTPFQREAAYRALLEEGLTAAEIEGLTEGTLKGWALGPDRFKASLEKQAGRRVQPARRGRPVKNQPNSI